jgi:hypothetical protein
MLNLLLCDSVTFSPFSLRQRELFSLCGFPFPSAALCDHPLPTQSTLQTQSKNQLNQPFDQHLTSSTSETSRALKDVPRTQDSRTQNSNLVCSSCMSCISCMVHQYAAPYDKSSPHHSPFTIHHPTQNPKLTTGPPPCVLQNISSHRSSTHHCHRR